MYILSTVGVVFVGRLVCPVNMLYMELSYTGSLDRSTRASEHVTVQISIPVRLPGWYFFIIIWNGYVLFIMNHLEWICSLYYACGLLVDCLFCEHALYGTKLHWFIGPVD